MTIAVALTHVPFEDTGTLAEEFVQRGIRFDVIDACTADLFDPVLRAADLLVVLGGPIGVYENAAYPFIDDELRCLRERLSRGAPTLGICLGAQLMAAALGAAVYPGGRGKELGWAPLLPGRDRAQCPAMEELLQPDLAVLHWHGDTFDLPAGAAHLAASSVYENQGWSLGRNVLALQFHPEVTVPGLERWYVGHAAELGAAKIDVPKLREDSARHGPALREAAQRFWRRWLNMALNP